MIDESMDLDEIIAFLRVAELRSFTAAAKRLDVPKSTVSRRVARLEERLGAQLVLRTTRRLSLTDAGTAYHDRVAQAVADMQQAAQSIRELSGTPRGHLRVSTPTDVPALAHMITAFIAAHPEVTVEVEATARRVDLIAEGFDLAIRAAESLPDSTLVARRVGGSPFRLYAAASYVAERGRPATPAALAEHRCVLFRSATGTAEWTLTGPDGPVTVAVSGPLSASDLSFVRHACLAGAGVALLPRMEATVEVQSGRMVRVLPGFEGPEGALWVVSPPTRRLSAKVRLFSDFARDWLARGLREAADPSG